MVVVVVVDRCGLTRQHLAWRSEHVHDAHGSVLVGLDRISRPRMSLLPLDDKMHMIGLFS